MKNINLLRFALISLHVIASNVLALDNFKAEVKNFATYSNVSGDSLADSLGAKDHFDDYLVIRLMDNGYLSESWSWNGAVQLDAQRGKAVELERELRSLGVLPPSVQRRNALNLEYVFKDEEMSYVSAYIDRANLTYSSDAVIFKLGRQSLTWGSGLVFHPLDIVNPFSPDAIDTEYKSGSDMLYFQYLFNSGADLQAVVVPRRDITTNSLEESQSAIGLKWHDFLNQQYGYTLLLAKNYEYYMFGASLSGSLAGSSWTLEASLDNAKGGKSFLSYLANVQYAWQFLSKNWSGYMEYYHNGYGVYGKSHTLDELPQDLLNQLEYENVFNVSKDYVALGFDLEATALAHIKPMMIYNINDQSKFFSLSSTYSINDDLLLTTTAQLGLGQKGSEYGGMKLDANSDIYIKSDLFISLQLNYYF